jgi:hypothetical protein
MIGDNEYAKCDENPHRKNWVDVNGERIVHNNGFDD